MAKNRYAKPRLRELAPDRVLRLSDLSSPSGPAFSFRSLARSNTLAAAGFSPRIAQGIDFGRPSSLGGKTSANTPSAAQNLLSTLVGGGPAGLISSLTGVGGIESLIKSLFSHGPKVPPPLFEFRLPGSVDATVTVGKSAGPSHYAVSASSAPVAPQPLPATSASTFPSDVLSAVKLGLLRSSSLGDVIAEL